MDGIILLLIGATLLINGMSEKMKIANRSLVTINLLTGSLSFIINLMHIFNGDYFEAGSSFLFTFTYLLIGFSYAFKLDMTVYGLFALFVSINTVPCALEALLIKGDPFFCCFWFLWGILWFFGFLQYGIKKT